MKIKYLIGFLVIAWLATLTPPGYKLEQHIFNNPLHNQLFCSVFSVLDKHDVTKPDFDSWKIYLQKCMIPDKNQLKKIEDYLEKNKEILQKKIKKMEFKLDEEK